MNMIEKVGKAICIYIPKQPNQGCNNACNACKNRAKAAIEAMKEPTLSMLCAGDILSDNYKAMIQAALEEK